jgi:hypothetical protein
MLKLFLSLLIFIQASHVSLMTVECIPENRTIKVFLKQDQADFVFDYRYMINDDQNISLTAKLDTTEILVSKYFSKRLQISAGNKRLTGKITKLEWNNSGMTAELEYHFNNKSEKAFTVKNTILNGIREDPSNLVIFKYRDLEEGVKFNLVVTEHVFRIKK